MPIRLSRRCIAMLLIALGLLALPVAAQTGGSAGGNAPTGTSSHRSERSLAITSPGSRPPPRAEQMRCAGAPAVSSSR